MIAGFILAMFLFFSANCFAEHFLAVCNKPVANVWVDRTKDCPTHGLPFIKKDLKHLVTQILYGDLMCVVDKKDDWFLVDVLTQSHYDDNQQQLVDISGWIKASDVTAVSDIDLAKIMPVLKSFSVIQPWFSIHKEQDTNSPVVTAVAFGTQLFGLPYDEKWVLVWLTNGSIGFIKKTGILSLDEKFSQEKIRESLVAYATMFLDSPYCWGGCCAWDRRGRYSITGVDSSGIVHLCHKACGIVTPRDAYSQYIKCDSVEPLALQPGDLAFFMFDTKKNKSVCKVAMYVGDHLFIEAASKQGSDKKVHLIKDTDLLGISLDDIENNSNSETTDEKMIRFGTFIKGG